MAYYILYAQGFNEGGVFVRDPARPGRFVLQKDVSGESDMAPRAPGRRSGAPEGHRRQPRLQAAVAGKEFVPIRAEDLGVDGGRRPHPAHHARPSRRRFSSA